MFSVIWDIVFLSLFCFLLGELCGEGWDRLVGQKWWAIIDLFFIALNIFNLTSDLPHLRR